MTPCQLPLKLLDWIDRGIDLATERALDLPETVHDVAERHTAHNQEIDVAVVPKLVPRGRAEDERSHDAIRQRRQRIAQHVHQSGRLGKERPQLGEHW